ncbi:hypothetical protein M422DRAFT_143596, partial [Sphaerobolus stellatus SS14]
DSVNEYVDRFRKLVFHSEYVDDTNLVVKFKKGLNKSLRTTVVTTDPAPALNDLEAWIEAAQRVFEENIRAVEKPAPHGPKALTTVLRTLPPTPPKPLLQVAVQPPVSARNSTHFYQRPAWERRLPTKYVLAATPSSKSLSLKVSVQTTDTSEVFSTPVLVDCGATGQFMDADFVRRNQLTTCKLARAIPVLNVDGTRNVGGSVNEIVDLILCYNDHTERTSFAVTNLEKQDMILGFTWLKEHNPEIDWQTKEVKMSCC